MGEIESRIKFMKEEKEQLFHKTLSLLNLWQEISDNFYIERADFTYRRNLGTDYAANLLTSYPLMFRRTLGDTFSAMLRPDDKNWFAMRTMRPDREDDAARKWLERATITMRRAMYARKAQFERATKLGDHDFAAFGQCVLTVELNRQADDLLYRCWHLRDVRWIENAEGEICKIYRQWKPEAYMLQKQFDGRNGRRDVSEAVKKKIREKNQFEPINVINVVMKSDEYEAPVGKKIRHPWVSIMFEEETGHILEEKGMLTKKYVIPRWLCSDSQYAFSPATICALPDGRLIQAITLTLLEAGEFAVRPPMVTPGDILRSDIQLYSGGVTTYDAEYDETTGEILRPINIPKDGAQFGLKLRDDTKEALMEAFFLNKIGLPPRTGQGEMTAYESGQRVADWIRGALPIFAPMEKNYNGELCDQTAELMLHAGAFGPKDRIPPSLRGMETQFSFTSPLHEAIEQQKGPIFQQSGALIAEAIKSDPACQFIVDAPKALRDTLYGIGVPADWMRNQDEAEKMTMDAQQQQKIQSALALAQQAGGAAKDFGAAASSFQSPQAPAGQ